jgi:hypothetical protein
MKYKVLIAQSFLTDKKLRNLLKMYMSYTDNGCSNYPSFITLLFGNVFGDTNNLVLLCIA